jgi:hypothetical protein
MGSIGALSILKKLDEGTHFGFRRRPVKHVKRLVSFDGPRAEPFQTSAPDDAFVQGFPTQCDPFTVRSCI